MNTSDSLSTGLYDFDIDPSCLQSTLDMIFQDNLNDLDCCFEIILNLFQLQHSQNTITNDKQDIYFWKSSDSNDLIRQSIESKNNVFSKLVDSLHYIPSDS